MAALPAEPGASGAAPGAAASAPEGEAVGGGGGGGAAPEVGRIVQLAEAVVNRIAAGEVVVRPANALKELLENSLDAGSKHIVIAAKGGGMKMLRIEDDGHGIRPDDLPILCERFTTSKLRKYDDLASIETFGFRGEALASISHVGHVTVTTMTAQDDHARMAQYLDGHLRGPPKPCAGTRGTTLVVEDLFYNNQTRRQALGKDSVEHAKLLDVVQKYAIHNPRVSFTCKKATGTVAELHTAGGEADCKQVINSIYGSNLAKNLFPFEASCDEPRFSCRGLATGPEWTARTFAFTCFINNRLVDCGPLRRAIEAVYVAVLARHQHPWVFLALDLDPAAIDVNVHPTKMEVQFLGEESIAQCLQEALQAELAKRGGARSFDAQRALAGGAGLGSLGAGAPGAALGAPRGRRAAPSGAGAGALGAGDAEGAGAGAAATEVGGPVASFAAPPPDGAPAPGVAAPPAPPTQLALGAGEPVAAPGAGEPGSAKAGPQSWQLGQKKAEPNPTRIRTDHRQQSLESIWRGPAAGGPAGGAALAEPAALVDAGEAAAAAAAFGAAGAQAVGGALVPANSCSPLDEGGAPVPEELSAERRATFEEAQQLTAICELKATAALSGNAEASKVLHQSVYVGPVSRELVLLQCGSKLCLVNLALLARESAYQRLLRYFGGVGRIVLKDPLPLRELLRLGILDPGSGYDPEAHRHVSPATLAAQLEGQLAEKAEMLDEYLMLQISDGMLRSLPNALSARADHLKFAGLPLFLVRLCADAEWDDEKACFESLCRLVADFCVDAMLPSEEDAAECDAAAAGLGLAGGGAGALNAAVEAGQFEDVAAAAAEARRKRARTIGPNALQELRWLHEAVRREGTCRWPAAIGKDGTVVDLVSLDQLYRIFERC